MQAVIETTLNAPGDLGFTSLSNSVEVAGGFFNELKSDEKKDDQSCNSRTSDLKYKEKQLT